MVEGKSAQSSGSHIVSTELRQVSANTFDTVTALAGLYLWLIFGFLTSLLGCDLQRDISKNIFVKHLLALISFFFLFSVIDQSNQTDVLKTWVKTIGVYLLFMISIKSKIYSSAVLLTLLIVDQTIKVHMNYKQQHKDDTNMETFQAVRTGIFYAIIAVAVAGFIAYFIRQHSEFGADFNYITFIFGSNKCADL